ncbi:hypothetical protein [Endozoicomonas sp. YOMI1]|uniref:hypothetical protein n=1 Tax=Endozoicomonas sp. YOMI1 TaxID=2828739 RepID=UPI0021483969|nr:hypothetical protein [Endozoicomonas sp. YOMI1]
MNITPTRPQPVPGTSQDDTISSKPDALIGLKRNVKELNLADAETTKLPKSSTATIPEEQIIERPVTSFTHRSRSAINNPDKMRTWCPQFEQIYKYLIAHDTPNLEAQLNGFTEDQIKSLLIAKAPHDFLTKNNDPRFYPSSLLEAAGESRAGRVFFRFLFDQLTPEELRDALLEPVDGDLTLLHHACCVMEESLFNQLEHKLGMETLIEMVTRPVNSHVPPLAHACLFNESTYLFDTAIEKDRKLIVKLLTGSPDIDETLLQFMFGDIAECGLQFYINHLNPDTHYQRTSHLLDYLNIQERFDAVRFTGKKIESPLLLACKKGYLDLFEKLTETFDDNQLVELYTAEAETNNSLLQKCFETNRRYQAEYIVNSIQCPSLRCKVMSVSTSEGYSVFQQLVVYNNSIYSTKKINHLLRGMKDSQVDQLITGNPNIWDEAVNGTALTLRQQELTPIVQAMNRNEMQLAKYLWTQITDPDLRINLLVYRSKHQTCLFQHLLETERQWLDNILANIHSKTGRDLLAAKFFQHVLETGSLDASDYLRQISDSPLITKLLQDNHKYFLVNLCNNGEMITEDYFSDTTPSQCTDSVVYVLEKSLSGEKHLKENLPQLITAQEKAGDKDAFVKWALSPLHGKESPLLRVLNRFAKTYGMRNKPVEILSKYRLTLEIVQREARVTKQLFQGMMSMMSEEQIKEFFLSGLVRSGENLHLFGYKDILATILGTLGDSGQAVLEKINPTTGENLLHLIFQNHLINRTVIKINRTVIKSYDLIETVVWLDETYGLTSFLQRRLESDGSTPLHVLLTSHKRKFFRSDDPPTVQKQVLEHLCKNADHTLLVELLKIGDHNGCTPLHKLFSFQKINDEVVDLLIEELGHETFSELMAIKDKQGKTAMDHFSTNHSFSYEKYNSMVRGGQ